ncbi:MAG: hypothetical protein ACI9N9_002384 [Enterobacterales bacterium]|jgi:hypothetical protein
MIFKKESVRSKIFLTIAILLLALVNDNNLALIGL